MGQIVLSRGFASGTARIMVVHEGNRHVLIGEIDSLSTGYAAHFRTSLDSAAFTPWASYALIEDAVAALAAFYPTTPIVRNEA